MGFDSDYSDAMFGVSMHAGKGPFHEPSGLYCHHMHFLPRLLRSHLHEVSSVNVGGSYCPWLGLAHHHGSCKLSFIAVLLVPVQPFIIDDSSEWFFDRCLRSYRFFDVWKGTSDDYFRQFCSFCSSDFEKMTSWRRRRSKSFHFDYFLTEKMFLIP